MSVDLSKLTEAEKLELIKLYQLSEINRKREWLKYYKPYPKQLEFHNAGVQYTERMFMASNQSGKTWAGGAEVAMHLTGEYPDWWEGRRIPHACNWLAGSESFELNKKGVQRVLLGPPANDDMWGTGSIPHRAIKRVVRQTGVQDAVSSIVVRHVSGEDSIINLSSYDQGRTKWQAETLDGVWFDEEPPLDIYQEGKTRVQVAGGPVITTFTPLLGMSQVVQMFMPLDETPLAPGRILINMTLEDALHYSPERRAQIIAGYTDADRDARAFGRPVMGEGLVFPVSESAIRVDPFPIPNYWKRICGIDFGWDHPFAAAWLAYDADTDTIYIYRVYREAKATMGTHAMNIMPQGPWIPIAWPHDGHKHDPKSGKAYSQLYKEDYGLKMLPTHATFGDDKDQQNYGFEAGISEMLDRMQTGRWKVFSTCVEWFQEFKGLHRMDGKVVKVRDDTISASRIAMMMRRHAVSPVEMRLNGTNIRTASPPRVRGFGVLDRETGY